MTTVNTKPKRTDPGFEKLMEYLPLWIREPTMEAEDVEEVRFDLGRRATIKTRQRIIPLDRIVSLEDVEHTKFLVGAFNENERAGIDGALHRISPIRDDNKLTVGLTVRVAQHVPGAAAFLKDVLIDPDNRYKSLLLVGPPGVGKTTILRDTSAILSDESAYASDVVVVDSSAEIGGAGRVPDPCIGLARRMQIPHDMTQADVLMFAVRNHGPSVIIADEIGYESDADVIATIAQRGVKVIATGHGTKLSDIKGNRHLKGLVGDPDTSLGRRLNDPVFQQALEIRKRGEYYFHPDVAASIDALLEGNEPPGIWLS